MRARVALLSCAVGIVACGAHGVTPARRAAPAPAPAAAAGAISAPGADWSQFGYTAQRSGVGPARTGITAANVSRLRARIVRLDGTVDSSAIELHGVIVGGRRRDAAVLTTTYGRTIAIDPATGARLWEYVPADIGAYQGSYQITTTTPIADPDRRYVYAASPDGRIHKLALSSGREVRSGHWPVLVTFDAHREKLASALGIDGPWLIAVTGGYVGDQPPYQGHVVAIDRASGRVVSVFNSLCSDRRHLIHPPASCPASDSAIWARAGAVVEPGGRRILLATGNGPFNGSTDWGDSVLELSMPGLRLLHNWTPADQRSLNDTDTDLGSTAPAPVAIPGHRLAVQGGKDGKLHLLNLDALDGTRGRAGPRLGGEVSETDAPGGAQVLSAPVIWRHAGRSYVFVADDSATAAYVVRGGRRPSLARVWETGAGGTSPVLAGGLLYVYDEQAGALHVYAPARGRVLASLPAATGHWNSPIVAGGRVLLPTGNANDHATSGELIVYHLPGR